MSCKYLSGNEWFLEFRWRTNSTINTLTVLHFPYNWHIYCVQIHAPNFKIVDFLRRGISFVFLKYTINEYNPPMCNVTVPNERCSYTFCLIQSNHHQDVDQECKKEFILRIAFGRDLGLTEVVTYVLVICRKSLRIQKKNSVQV